MPPVDLEKVIKDNVAHPLFRGRTSLKVTLPVLVPSYKTRYAALTVSNGADAATAFERLASPDTTPGGTLPSPLPLFGRCSAPSVHPVVAPLTG